MIDNEEGMIPRLFLQQGISNLPIIEETPEKTHNREDGQISTEFLSYFISAYIIIITLEQEEKG
jgi:hypothetical protein